MRKIKGKLGVAGVVLVTCALLGMSVAVAQEAGGKPGATTTRDSKIKGKGTGNIRVNDADARAVEDLGQLDIEGRIHKPAVYYMLARGEIQYAGIEFKQNFTDRIVKGALKRPF